jgi:peptidyl-prolyl cis-trans isomerase D
VFVTVTAIQEPSTPPLDDVKEQVREDVIRRKSMVLAQEKAAEAARTLKAATDFAAAAKAAGFTVGTSELIARGAAFPEVGASAAVEATAFSLQAGAVSNPVSTGSAAAVVHVVERQGADPTALAQGKESLRTELLQQRQGQFFGAYMNKVKERLRIDVDLNLLEQVLAV